MSTKIKKNSVALLLIFFSAFSINQCYAVAVGESYGGGTIFCVSPTADTSQCVTTGSGDCGLIMANEDQANFDTPNHGVHWSSVYSDIHGAYSLDDGATNTAAIIAAFPQDNPGNNAAWLSHSYRDQEEHTDWYLPSKNELNKMYTYARANNLIGRGCSGSRPGGVQCLLGGYNCNVQHKVYWSSSEVPRSYAWCQDFSQDFSNGNQMHGTNQVNGYFGVRVIRAFNNSPIYQFNDLLLRHYSRAAALVFMIEERNSDIERLRFAISHPDLDTDGLTAISRHPGSDATILLAVAQNPITDVVGLRAIVAHPNVNDDILEVVAGHHNADAPLLLDIASR